MKTTLHLSRRSFLRKSALFAGAALSFPTIVPSSVFGQNAPSNRIGIALIGTGNIMRGHQGNILGRDDCQILAVCDVRRDKREENKAKIEAEYAKKTGQGSYKGCDAYNEFERVMQRDDIEAVVIGTRRFPTWPCVTAKMCTSRNQ